MNPLPNERDRFESTVRVLRKSGHGRAVIHPPAVDPGEVIADLAPGERAPPGPCRSLPGGIVVDVVDAEQERIGGRPLKAERNGLEH